MRGETFRSSRTEKTRKSAIGLDEIFRHGSIIKRPCGGYAAGAILMLSTATRDRWAAVLAAAAALGRRVADFAQHIVALASICQTRCTGGPKSGRRPGR